MLRRWNRERGISYTLPFVLVIPFFLMFMALTVEIAFLLQAKLGTMTASFAAARAAIVWRSAEPAELRESRPRQAAITALAPFVGGRQREIDGAGPIPPDAESQAEDFAVAGARFMPSDTADAEFLKRKVRNAAARAEVTIEAESQGPRALLRATVRFRAPLYVPVASRFLDRDGTGPFEYPLSATATLPNDAPVSENGTLGIAYSSDLMSRGGTQP